MKIKEKPTALKLIAAVLSLLMISSVLPYFAVTASAAQITPSTPQKNSSGVYQIGTAEELYGFAQLVNGGNTTASAVLTADIIVNTGVLKADGTLNSGTFTDWTPIGNSSNQYTGKFDGQGHTISGLYFNDSSTNYVGLFGDLGSGGEIKNTGVIDSYFNGSHWVGGVCGYNWGGTITGCYNTGTVTGHGSVGGVCGNSEDAKITSCYNTGTVSGNSSVGGVSGYNGGGAITGCYNTGTVTGKSSVGGVCGYNYEGGKITDCYNTGKVSGGDGDLHVGGVCGLNFEGTITGCYTNNKGICGTNEGGTISSDCAVKSDTEFKNGTVCKLLNTALKNANSDVRFYQGANYPKLCLVPALVDGVYQISNKLELYGFAQLVNSKTQPSANAVLTKDIVVNTGVLNDKGELNPVTFTDWIPIGTDYDHTYTGKFDGQGHTISGLYFNNTNAENVGLFGYLGLGGEIKNVGVIDSYFNGNNYVGGVCGRNNGAITGSYNTGTVSGMFGVGGVCGRNYGTIIGCYNTGTVSGMYGVGGVCGNNHGGTITGCYTNRSGDTYYKPDAEFKDNTVCKLLNTALKNVNPDIHFYQGANYPELIVIPNLPKLVDDVYQISNKQELYAFAQLVNNAEPSANAVLTADITVNNNLLSSLVFDDNENVTNGDSFESWTPIGNFSNKYTGKFDGQGHTVIGLYFNNTNTDYVGLFGYLGSGGEIKNVGVIDSYFSGRESVGGVCGWNDGGTITGCYNTGAVSSSGYYVGGVCAVNKGGTIIGCYNTGTVSGVNGVGGVCAVNNSTITGCYNTGEVIGTTDVGGVCGFNSGTITGCYTNNGGVCGNNFRGTVTDSDVKTDAEFANGTVCKLLNTALKNASSKVLFCQTIGTDALPLLDYQIEEHTPLYTVENKTFKVTCLCGKKSKTMELTLKTDKTVVVNGAENTLTATLSNLENEAVTYKWYQNGVEIQGETLSTYKMPTDLAAGTYTYKVEVTMENVGTITQSVDVLVDITPQYYVNIPATVNIGDNFTVGASGVLLKNNAKLNVSLLSDFTLSTAKGASLNYEILTSNSKLTSGDTLLTVQGSQDLKAPGSGTSETYNVALALGETPTHSGNYTDTLTFTIKVEP